MLLAFDPFFIVPTIMSIIFGIVFITVFVFVITSIIRNVKNAKDISKDIIDVQKKVVEKIKNGGKVTCQYCNSTFDAKLDKCPNCSASVKEKGEN